MPVRSLRFLLLALPALCLLAGAGITPLHAQYAIRSPYLLHPEKAIGYVDSCAAFWIPVEDPVNGGFFTNVDRTGNVITAWGTNKNLVSQSRDAYGFTRAFMLTGNEGYLTYARHALDFMEAHAWDQTNGGWFGSNDMVGNPMGPTAPKTAFDQHYALLGITSYYEATRDTMEWRWLLKGYGSNEQHLWDAGASSFGYYDNAPYNWSAPTGKSFNATVDAITTHLLSVYLLTGDDVYRTRLLQVSRNILDHLVPSMEGQIIGFVESYGTDWSWDNATANNNTRTIMGHVLKTAWCLGRMHQLFPDTAYLNAAEKLAGQVWLKGYDHDFGGPYKDYDRVTGVMYLYGQADSAKAWWQMEQAVTAGLMLYEITGKPEYLEMADETLDFFMTYFVDHQYGEVYADRTRRGGQIWGNEKGSSGKAAYHSTELGYYVYLYGNLFVKHEPVVLHYMYTADATDRSVRMNPVAYASSKYRLKQVLHNGAAYADFDATGRILHLPPGTGGHFTVTYEPVPPNAVTQRGEVPATVGLAQNYPNPFNPSTTISYHLAAAGDVTLRVYDLLGRDVATLVDRPQPAGRYHVTFDGRGLASGVYIYRLKAGSFVEQKRMVLLK